MGILNEIFFETFRSWRVLCVSEIRKLDSQLDHLNDYMSKMEERLKLHNEKLMETLRHQKEEREKRRRSFHEVSKFFMASAVYSSWICLMTCNSANIWYVVDGFLAVFVLKTPGSTSGWLIETFAMPALWPRSGFCITTGFVRVIDVVVARAERFAHVTDDYSAKRTWNNVQCIVFCLIMH